MTGDHDEVRLLLGPYVLGGLAAADRRKLEEHLSGCEACRSELARSAPLPALLRRLPVEEAMRTDDGTEPTPDSVSAGVLPGLLAAVERDRRRGRRRTALRAVLIAATVAAVTALGVVGLRDARSDATVMTLTAIGASPAGGDVALVEKPWGTALTLRVSGLPDGGPFVLQVTGAKSLDPEPAATWAATPGGSVEVVGASSIVPDDIAEISVLGPDGEILVSR